jgi:hypothetical protein
VRNWDDIQTIYSKDHANGVGARTAGECLQENDTQVAEDSPEVPPKRQRLGDAILCMMGDMTKSFDEALKTTEPLPMPKVTPPTEVLAEVKKVDGLGDSEIITAYAKLTANERSFECFMALPEDMKKAYLLALP